MYVEPYLDSMTYYSLFLYSRTVAITGALQLGWRTTLTTLSTPHPVSADRCNSFLTLTHQSKLTSIVIHFSVTH